MSKGGDPSLLDHPFVARTSCNRCRPTDCPSIHDHTAPYCPLPVCEACTDLAQLNEQIDAVHDQLVYLIQKRWALKSRVNNHHDLTRRLPVEIISEIFLLVAEAIESSSSGNIWSRPRVNQNCPPIFLGVICKRWRNITLGLPQLWCELDIIQRGRKLSATPVKEWLRRSSTASLSIVYVTDSIKNCRNLLELDLLRSHASRWKHFTFSGPWKLFHRLFHNIDGDLSLETLDISIVDEEHIIQEKPVQLQEPLFPKTLTVCYVPLYKIPLQWNNLTRLEAHATCLDEVLHIICHAPNLTHCIIDTLRETEQITYPLPTVPIVHNSIIVLTLGTRIAELIPYLILPSLQTFNFTFYFDARLGTINSLVEFLARSGTALRKFTFDFMLNTSYIPWYEHLPAITHLQLYVLGHNNILSRMEDIFRALARTSGTLILPHLQELRIKTRTTEMFTWSLLCDIFNVNVNDHDQNPAGADVHKRPLKAIYIQHDGPTWGGLTDADIFSRILNIKASGVHWEVVDESGCDLIACAANMVLYRDLPFSRDGELHKDNWSLSELDPMNF